MRGDLGGGSPGSPLEPFLGSSHWGISAVLLCCRDGAGLSPGTHFTDEDVETLCVPAGFA